MQKDFVFYTHPMSRGRTVRCVLEEIGCEYQTELLDYNSSMKAPEYLKINPLGKVPALRHGDTVITESAAICAYLADAFPDAKLAPLPTDTLRGAYYRWLFFTAGPLEMGLVNRVMGIQIADEQKKMVGYGEPDQMLDMLDSQIQQGEYLLGSQFSVADIYVSALLGWGMHTNMIAPRESFARYYEMIQARPAMIRATKMDDDLLVE